MTLAHGPRSMWTEKRVYERVERPSVYPIDWQQQRRVAGLLLSMDGKDRQTDGRSTLS